MGAYHRKRSQNSKLLREALFAAVGREPDSEAWLEAPHRGSFVGGIGWIVTRYVFWAPDGFADVVGLPATHVVRMATRQAADGMPQFRLQWTDWGDDELAGATYVNPPNPWDFVVTSPGSFVEDLTKLNTYFPRTDGRRYMDSALELRRRTGVPVSSWSDCPICSAPMGPAIEGAARCDSCDRVFTDPEVWPVLDRTPARFGAPLRVLRSSLLAVEFDQGITELPNVWLVKPLDDHSLAPDTVKELLIMWAAVGYVPR